MAHKLAPAGASRPPTAAPRQWQGWVSLGARGCAAPPPPALTRVAPQSRGSVKPGQKVVVGICALEKKARAPAFIHSRASRRRAARSRAAARCRPRASR